MVKHLSMSIEKLVRHQPEVLEFVPQRNPLINPPINCGWWGYRQYLKSIVIL